MARKAWRAAFSIEEHESRLRRVQSWMKQSGYDLLLITDPAHYNYLGGVDNTGVFYYQVLFVLPHEGSEPIFLSNRGDTNLALESSWLDDIRVYWNYDDKIEKTVEIAAALLGTSDFTGLKIGMNLSSHYTKVTDYQALVAKLDGASIENCHVGLDDIRLIKTPAEIEVLRYSTFMSDMGFITGVNAIHEGVYDREVYAAIEQFLYINGAEWRAYPTLIGGTGRSPDGTGPKEALHGTPVGRRLKEGDLLYLEISGNYKRYNCNISRMVHIGEPPPRVLKAHQLVRDNLLRGQDAIAPGVPTRRVYELANTYPPEWQKYARASIGFSNELSYPPIWMGSLRFDAVDDHIFEPGMVVCLEPGFSYFDGNTMELGNMILVTDDGHEILNNTPLDLVIR
jgi:ectoine hydrolase